MLNNKIVQKNGFFTCCFGVVSSQGSRYVLSNDVLTNYLLMMVLWASFMRIV